MNRRWRPQKPSELLRSLLIALRGVNILMDSLVGPISLHWFKLDPNPTRNQGQIIWHRQRLSSVDGLQYRCIIEPIPRRGQQPLFPNPATGEKINNHNAYEILFFLPGI